MSYIDDIKRKYGLSSLDLYKKDQDYSSYISEKYGLSSKVEEDEEDYSERLAREISGSMGTTPRRQNLWIDEETYTDVSQSRGLGSTSEKVGDKFARDTAEGRSFGSSGRSYVDRENSRIKNALRYVTAGAMRSTVEVAGSLNPMAIVDSAFELGSSYVGVVYNRIARGIGSDKEWEIKTLSQAVQDVIQRDGVAPFRTDNIKNETIKNVLEDINKGTGIIEGMNRRAQEFWQRNQDDVSERVSKATKITSMVVESIPQMALMLLGQGAYAVSAASRAMLETREDGKIDQREVERALWSANAEIFSEMIFGLYDDASVLIKGALTRQAGRVASDAAKGVATKITPLMLARGVALQGLEEGAEEVLSYIMQVGIDRNYLYPEKGYFDVFDFEELGTSALVGFLAGGIMSTPQAITNGRLEMSERRELIALADKFRGMDIKDIDAIKPNTKEAIEAARFVYLIQKGKDKRNPVDYDAVNEMDMESKTAFVSQNPEHTIDVDGGITRLTSLERMRPSGVLSTQATVDRNLQQQVEQESPVMAETAQEPAVPTGSRSVEVSQSTMELGNQTVNTDRLSLGNGELMIMTNSPYAPNNMNSVYNFFVPEDMRRQGIGTALINEAKTRYGEKGISAQVSNENSLRLFYNNGFYPAQNPDATLDQALEMFRENESLNMRYIQGAQTGSRASASGKIQEGGESYAETGTERRTGTESRIRTAIEESKKTNNRAISEERLSEGESRAASRLVNVNYNGISDANAFSDAITTAKTNNPYGAFVEAKPVGEYAKKGTKLYLSDTGGSGFAVTADGDFVSLFKNPDSPDVNSLHNSVISGLANGAKKLDCFDGFLPEHYSQYGYEAVARVAWDDQFAPDNWNYERDGTPDVVFMVHNGDGLVEIEKKLGTYPAYNSDNVPLVDYDTAVSLQERKKATAKKKTVAPQKEAVAPKANVESETAPAEEAKPKKRTVDMTPLNSLPTETAEVNGHEVQAIGEVRIAQPHGGNLTAFIVKAYKNAIDIVPNNRTRTNANPERWRYQPSTDTFRPYAGSLDYIRKSEVDYIIEMQTFTPPEIESPEIDTFLNEDGKLEPRNGRSLDEPVYLYSFNSDTIATQKMSDPPELRSVSIDDLKNYLVSIGKGDQIASPVAEKAPAEKKAPVKKKAPAKKPIKKSDLTVMAERGAGSAEIHQAIKDWVKTDEAAKEFKDIKTPTDVAEAIIDYKQNFNERLASWKGKGGFLQMLAMLEWADRIKAAPEGSAVSLAMQHMTEALVSGQPDMVKSVIESRIDDDALFHVILTNNDQAEIAKGNRDQGEKYLSKLLRRIKRHSYTPEPNEVIYLLNHIKELQGTEGFGDDAYYIMQHLSARLMESGQAIQSMRLLRKIFPEYQAQSIIKSYESEIPQKDTFDLDRNTELTNEILEEVRDEAIDESVRDIQTTLNQYEDISNIAEPETEQDIRKLEETQGIGSELDTLKKREQQNRAERKKARAENRRPRVRKVLSTSERLAIRIKNDVKRIDGAPKTEDEVGRLIDNLFKKYKQTLRDMNKPIPPTSFEQLADIVLNRKEYAVVWESAQENIKSDPQYAEHQALIEYLDTQSDPVMTKKLMERVVADTIKSEKVNLESAAKEYYLLGNKSLMRYKLKLNALMPTLDVKSREYMNQYIDDTFRKMMDKRRSNAVARLREQVRQSRKPVKEADPMNVFINNIYDAAYKDSLNEANKEIRQNWANRLGVPVLTDAMVKHIYDAAFSIAAQPDTDAQANELEKLLKKLSREMKATKTEQLITLARAAMMSLPVTWTRNASTNAMAIPIFGLQDRIQLKIEERLGVTPSKRISSNKFIKADETTELGRYVLKHYSDKKIRQISAGSEKFMIKSFLGIEKIMFDDAKIDSLIKASYRITNDGEILGHEFKWLGDIGILSKHYRTALIRSLDVQGFDPSKGVKGQESIIAEAEKIALDTAIVRVFRQSTWVSTLFANWERTLSNPDWAKTARREGHYAKAEGIELLGKAGLLGVKILQPFVKTPAAIAKQGFDWSPAALAIGVGRLIYNQQKHRIGVAALDTKRADDLAKHISKQIAGGLAGTVSTFMMGFVLSAMGFIEVDEPDDAKEKAVWDIMGRRRYYLKLPLGIRISLDYMQPISTGIIMGAHFGNMFNGETFLDASEEAVVGAFNSLLESTVLDSLSRAFGGSYNKTLSEKVRDFGIDGMTQLVPNVMRGLNRVVDPYVRDVYSGTPLIIAKNRAIQGVPFATYTIPSKIDLWGQPVRRSPIKGVFGVAERTIVNIVLPFTVSYENQDPVTKEVVRLFNEVEGSAGNKAIPSIPSATISRTETVDGQKVAKEWNLTGDDYENFLKEIGQMRYRAIQQALKDPEYKAKSSEEKIKVLNDIYTESSNIVRDKYVIENPNGWTPKE